MSALLSRGIAAIACAIALGAVSSGPALSTTMIRYSTEELTVVSDYVVEGVVTHIESRFREDHQSVYTYVTVQVNEVYKGRLDTPAVVLEEVGGTANGVSITVISSPEFSVGERVILFLETKNADYLRVYGMAQGKFTVVTDGTTGARTLVRQPGIDETFNRSYTGELDSTVNPATGVRDYDAFVGTIKAWADRLTAPGGGR
jgi:hypothetical protein